MGSPKRIFYCGAVFISLLSYDNLLVYAAFEQGCLGARQCAIAGAFTSIADDNFAIFYNPSGLSQLSKPLLSAAYCRPYGLKELNQYSGVVAFPRKKVTYAGAWNRIGFSLYNEQWILLGTGFRVFPRLAIGSSFKYYSLAIARYGSRNILNGDIGFLYFLHEKWQIGGAVSNVFNKKILNTPLLERKISFGVSYHLMSSAKISIDSQYISGSRITYMFGIEIPVEEIISFGFGFQNESGMVAGGIGFILHRHRVDYAVSHHPMLGNTHSFSLSFTLF